MIVDDPTLLHLKTPGQKLRHSGQLGYPHTGIGARAGAGLPWPSLQLLSTNLLKRAL